jgi:hypothetical protein
VVSSHGGLATRLASSTWRPRATQYPGGVAYESRLSKEHRERETDRLIARQREGWFTDEPKEPDSSDWAYQTAMWRATTKPQRRVPAKRR